MTPSVIPPSESPVVYPTITVNGQTFQLRFGHGAWYQLQSWGFVLGDEAKPIPILALAAAAAGQIDPVTGRWKTAGYVRPLDLADAMLPGETLSSLDAPVLEALKKAAPAATLTLIDQPAKADPPAAAKPDQVN